MTVSVRWLAFLVVFGLVSTESPAWAQRRELQQLAADVRILQEQTQLLQNALAGLTDALKAVNARIDEQTGVNRKGFADAKLQADSMGGDLRVVRERVDDTNVRITSVSQEVESLRDAIAALPIPTSTDLALLGSGGADAAPGAPGASGAAAPGAPVPAPPAPAQVPSTTSATTVSPTRLYDMAWADYTAGNYDLAVEGFSSYVRSFPKSEFADNAQYYIGQSYFLRGKYPEAVDAFNRVIAAFPRSDIIGQAYFNRGRCFEEMKQPDRARESYDYVVRNLGETDAGRLAKQRLDALTRARPQ